MDASKQKEKKTGQRQTLLRGWSASSNIAWSQGAQSSPGVHLECFKQPAARLSMVSMGEKTTQRPAVCSQGKGES